MREKVYCIYWTKQDMILEITLVVGAISMHYQGAH